MSAPIANATTAATKAEEGHKVFIGNISFSTTEEDLKQIFQGKGNITEAQVIYRGQRSLGYGFVTFEKADDAANAISALDKTEVNGRTVNLEIAKPPSSTPRGGIAKEAAKAAGGEASTADHEVTGTGEASRGRSGRGRGRGGRGRGRGGRRAPAADGEADGGAPAQTDGLNEQLEALKVSSAPDGTPEAVPEGGRRGRGRGLGRGRGAGAARRGPPTGEPSKTLLFIANLPFSLDNDGLKAIFDGYNVTSAHVVVRKYGPISGRSKGFGFVELADEAEQKRALEAFQGKEIEGREIQVKVAIDTPPEEQQQAEPVAA